MISPQPPEPHSSSAPPPVPGTSIDSGRGRVFPCERCGADLEFHIGAQSLKCPYCGFEKRLEGAEGAEILERDYGSTLERLAALKRQRASSSDSPPNRAESVATAPRHLPDDQSQVQCASCGATVVFSGTLISSRCPYCGVPLQRDRIQAAIERLPIDAVLPFVVPEDRAAGNLRAWVRGLWFAPNAFLKQGVEGRFTGNYLPFFTFDTLTSTRYSGERGDRYTVVVGSGKDRRTVTRIDWSHRSGEFQRFFDDVLVLGARGLNPTLVQQLEPWPLDRCRPFSPEMLAGFLARTYDIELAENFQRAKARIDAALLADVRHRIGGDEQRVHHLATQYQAITFKHILLPVWLLTYRYQNRPYQVVVNAVTGEVQGERPWSWVKITLAVIAGLAVAGVAAWVYSQFQ